MPKRKVKQEINGQFIWHPAEPTELDLNSIRNEPVLLAAIRLRLSDISRWMRLLCQYIALRANCEDEDMWLPLYKVLWPCESIPLSNAEAQKAQSESEIFLCALRVSAFLYFVPVPSVLSGDQPEVSINFILNTDSPNASI